ncbi:STAS domain-containing protein [bacterium]|nr:STAS domain-containing protein [bacterium]
METDILQLEPHENALVIRLLESRIYQDVIPGFREQVLSVLDAGHTTIVFDLSRVDVMNSSGLGILILLQDELDRRAGTMILSGLGPVMEQLFTQMKLETLFTVAKTESDALDMI